MKRSQTGLFTVELAMVGLLFFFILFGVIETGRVMFTMSALNEATRLGARAATVCSVQDNVISTISTFNASGILSGLAAEHIVINYLDKNGSVIGNPSPANQNGFLQIQFVQVSIQGFDYTPLVPGVGSVTLPSYSTTLPRQSLGITPNEMAGC